MGAVTDPPCHLPQEVRGGRLRVESLFRFFGADGYFTGGAPQNGANIIGENERLAFFEDSLCQGPHIIPVECFGHGLTYRLFGWHKSKGHCLWPSQYRKQAWQSPTQRGFFWPRHWT